MAYFQGQ